MASLFGTGERLRRWAQAVSALATVVVAVLAYFIQQDLAEQEGKRAAVARSVALFRDIVGTDEVKVLVRLSQDIEYALSLKGSDVDIQSEATKIFAWRPIAQKRSEIRSGLISLLRTTRLIHQCGRFEEVPLGELVDKSSKPVGGSSLEKKRERVDDQPLCDRDTVSVLLGPILAELHYRFRPVLYCERFFVSQYYSKGDRTGYIGMYEDLVIHHLETDYRNQGLETVVFRDDEARQSAIDKKLIKRADKNYAVIRLNATEEESHCKVYPFKT